ncbi:MAG TPA: PIN domain-containing protein [Fluviicola sp.]|nr:PIN domain-containing protein [Fluviicola sp.]
MAKILLDTNIIIHREANKIVNKDIGILFNWFDRLKYEKWVHRLTVEEIKKHKDPDIVSTMEAKIRNYHIQTIDSHDNEVIERIRKNDTSENDSNDTSILKELYFNRFDYLITEDRNIHKKANLLSISEKVFTIDSFLEKVNAENPELVNYKVLSVKKVKFGEVNIKDSFFDSFKNDYAEFENWFVRKSEELSYVCLTDGAVRAFLFLKVEGTDENYSDVTPILPPKKRLKIGTFKVESTGLKLGERFLKIIFDNALINNVDEIYVTIFGNTEEQIRLIRLLEDWGFTFWGEKSTQNGIEKVYIRDFRQAVNTMSPKLSFPLVSGNTNKFIVPIYPDYHTSLLPDSILNTESPTNFEENEPFRNAIQKVYISRSINRNLNPGDLIIFYRTKEPGSNAYYNSVVTTIAIVENTIQNIANEEQFIKLCRKRSVFTDDDLRAHWNHNPRYRPFIVNFLHVYSLPRRINLQRLIELGVIANITSVPRGFEPLNDTQFQSIISESGSVTNFLKGK